MYIYYIYHEDFKMYLLGWRRGPLPVPTCVWTDRLPGALAFSTALEAACVASMLGGSAAVYRIRANGEGNPKRIEGGENSE